MMKTKIKINKKNHKLFKEKNNLLMNNKKCNNPLYKDRINLLGKRDKMIKKLNKTNMMRMMNLHKL